MTIWNSLVFVPLVGQLALGVCSLAAIADTTPTPQGWVTVIGQFGISGVLAFILARLLPQLKTMEDRIHDRLRSVDESNATLAKSNYALIISLKQADHAHREAARGELRKLHKKYPNVPEEPET